MRARPKSADYAAHKLFAQKLPLFPYLVCSPYCPAYTSSHLHQRQYPIHRKSIFTSSGHCDTADRWHLYFSHFFKGVICRNNSFAFLCVRTPQRKHGELTAPCVNSPSAFFREHYFNQGVSDAYVQNRRLFDSNLVEPADNQSQSRYRCGRYLFL